MKRWIATVAVMGLVAGCQQPTVKQGKAEAQLHWQQTRARVTYGVALEQFRAGQLDRAASKAQEALSLNPSDGDIRLLLGEIYIEQGRYAGAVTELTTAQGQIPGSFEAAFMLGVAQEKAGRLDDALASYRKALTLDPSSCSAVMAGAEVMVTMGRVGEAQVFVDSHMGMAGDDPGMFELAGRLAMMLEDYPQAARNYAQASDLDPANVRYRECLGQSLSLARQYEEAVEALKTLLAMPKYTAPAWVQITLGDAYMALNRPADARTAYNAAKTAEPAVSRSWTNLAKAALALGDAAGAVIAAQESLQREPGALDASLLLGYALLRQGQARKAVDALSGTVEKYPEQIVLRCLLGRAYAAAGDSAAAVRCYTEALRIEPENALAKGLLAASTKKPAVGE